VRGKPTGRRRRWTEQDDELLERKWGLVSVVRLAQILDRSEPAISNRAVVMKLGKRRPPDALSLNELMHILGLAAHSRVILWIREGTIKAKRSTRYGGSKCEWEIRQGELERFLRENPHLVDRDKMDPAYQQFVAERWITLVEAFRRGAAYPGLLEAGAKAGLIPETRHRGPKGTVWVVPESILPRLVAARRTQQSDPAHWRLVVMHNQHEASGLLHRNAAHRLTRAREASAGGHSGARTVRERAFVDDAQAVAAETLDIDRAMQSREEAIA
jgi:hypothetical protein